MTKEEILRGKAWTPEQRQRIERGFASYANTVGRRENPKPYKLTLLSIDEVEKEVNKMLKADAKKAEQIAKVGGVAKPIGKAARESIETLLKKAKLIGFTDEELAGCIKAMIKQRQKVIYEMKMAEIDAM